MPAAGSGGDDQGTEEQGDELSESGKALQMRGEDVEEESVGAHEESEGHEATAQSQPPQQRGRGQKRLLDLIKENREHGDLPLTLERKRKQRNPG